MKGIPMADETYETPTITVLGEVTDMTQAKHGILLDFPGSTNKLDVKLKLNLDLNGLGVDVS